MARKEKGIRRRGNTWWVFVRVQGHLRTKTFALTELEAARAWREAQRQPAPTGGSFAAAVHKYLAQNQSKVSINQATAHLELWMYALGRDRTPLSITKDEINRVIDDWLLTLAPGTVRKRRMWLRQFFVFLTGDGGPCQKATNPKEPKAGARGIDYLVIEKALASMPARRSARRGTLGPPSLALLRARVMIYTGLPPKLLMAVTPDDLDFRAAKLYVHGRTKGDGVEERELALGPEALAAFKAYHAANAYGDGWSVSSMGRSVKAAFKRVGYMRPVRLYDLRHSYLTQVYRITRDTATVARLGMHAEGSPITARYTKGANQEVDEAAVAAFSQVLTARRRGALKVAVS